MMKIEPSAISAADIRSVSLCYRLVAFIATPF